VLARVAPRQTPGVTDARADVEEEAAQLAPRQANAAMEVDAHPDALALATLVDDRSQLRQIDYELARRVAEALSRRRGPRAFRHVPYRRLRRELGLLSLEHRRNQARPR